MTIDSWSHSRLGDFEKCKYMAWLKHDQRIPEPPRPLPPGKTEHANDRGSRIHDCAEMFVRGKGPFIPEMREFEAEFKHLQHLFKQGKVFLEGEWGMTEDWEITGWNGAWKELGPIETAGAKVLAANVLKKLPERGKKDALVRVGKKAYRWIPSWHRLKLDCLVLTSSVEAVVIDYKSGKKFGNEVKHGEQLQLYALNTFLRNPELEIVHAELWYLDVRDLTSVTYTRAQGLRARPGFDRRGHAITNATEFPPNPNVYSCRWCPYGPAGTGHCKVGIQK